VGEKEISNTEFLFSPESHLTRFASQMDHQRGLPFIWNNGHPVRQVHQLPQRPLDNIRYRQANYDDQRQDYDHDIPNVQDFVDHNLHYPQPSPHPSPYPLHHPHSPHTPPDYGNPFQHQHYNFNAPFRPEFNYNVHFPPTPHIHMQMVHNR
jgi:hypothetical protein